MKVEVLSLVKCLRRSAVTAWVLPAIAVLLSIASLAGASTYVVFLPLDSPIYDELDTLNSLGYLEDYLDEIKPISAHSR